MSHFLAVDEASFSIGDFNNDGLADAVDRSQVFRGVSTGGEYSLVPQPGAPGDRVAVGDFDRDGIDDYVLSTNNGLEVVRGSTLGPLAPALLRSGVFAPKTVDLDATLGSDLIGISGSGFGELTTLRNLGLGTFAADPPVPVGIAATDYTAADFNRDGFPDVAALTSPTRMRLWLSNATGALVEQAPFVWQPTPNGFSRLDVIDHLLSGTPRLELRTSSGALTNRVDPIGRGVDTGIGFRQISHALDSGVSGFNVAPGFIQTIWPDGGTGLGAASYPIPNTSALTARPFDANRDGYLDAFLGYANRGVAVIWGRPNRALSVLGDQLVAPSQFSLPLALDLDGDQRLDLVGAVSQDLVVRRTSATGAPLTATLGSLDNTYEFVSARVNADAIDDLIVSDDSSVRIFLGVPGAFPTLHASFALPNPPTTCRPGFEDVDGDGLKDLACLGHTNSSMLWAKGTTAGFAALRPLAMDRISSNDVPVWGDVDGDGLTDLVTLSEYSSFNRFSHLNVRRNVGGAFVMSYFNFSSADEGLARALGDLDGDGRTDLVTTKGSYRGDGVGRFGPFVAHPAPLEPGSVSAADVDGDRRLDLFDGQGFVILSSGTRRSLLVTGAPRAVDVNHDGVSDLLYGESNSTLGAGLCR